MNKRVLITGATKGIGRACAEAFARAGYEVTAVARTAKYLNKMTEYWRANFPESTLLTIATDLASPSGLDAIPQQYYDVVVLNAAAFQPGRLLEAENDHFAEMLGLNVMANHRLARRLLPEMASREEGHLVVIGSTGTDNWKGHMTAYVATKYALRGLFLGWEKDLADTRVATTLVAPGATLTASWENETPPPGILMPEEVAEVVLQVVLERKTGRVLVERS